MARMTWKEAFKRTRPVLREAFPDRAESMIAEIARWGPPVPARAGYYWCTSCRRELTEGMLYVHCPQYRNPERLERFRFPDRPLGWEMVFCRECVLDLEGWANDHLRAPIDDPVVAHTLAGTVRALRHSSRGDVEGAIEVLQRAATSPHEIEPPAADHPFCYVCGGNTPTVRYALCQGLVVCALCANRLGRTLAG